jgi:AAA domain
MHPSSNTIAAAQTNGTAPSAEDLGQSAVDPAATFPEETKAQLTLALYYSLLQEADPTEWHNSAAFLAELRATDMGKYLALKSAAYQQAHIYGTDFEKLANEGTAQRKETAASPTPEGPQPSTKTPAVVWQKATALMEEDLPPITWCIEELLPEGAAILAGRPKKGKSLLALNIAIAKATGGIALGKYAAGEAGDVAYLALEDGKRRMKTRLEAMLPKWEGKQPERLEFAYHVPRCDEGLLQDLEDWITRKEHPALIVVDILARVVPVRRQRGDTSYQVDYATIAALMDFATQHGVTILIVHHTNKAQHDDVMDSILGTTGVSGGTAVNMVLKRSTGETQGTLSITGKDLEDLEIALKLDNLCWQALGNAQEVAKTTKQQQVLDFLQQGGRSIQEIAQHLGQPYKAAKLFLWRMGEAGLIKLDEGKYHLTSKPPESPSSGEGREAAEEGGDSDSTPAPPSPPEECTKRETNETCETDETSETLKPRPANDLEGFKVSSELKPDETYFGIENTGVVEKVSKVSSVSPGFMKPAMPLAPKSPCPACGRPAALRLIAGGALSCRFCQQDFSPGPLARTRREIDVDDSVPF